MASRNWMFAPYPPLQSLHLIIQFPNLKDIQGIPYESLDLYRRSLGWMGKFFYQASRWAAIFGGIKVCKRHSKRGPTTSWFVAVNAQRQSGWLIYIRKRKLSILSRRYLTSVWWRGYLICRTQEGCMMLLENQLLRNEFLNYPERNFRSSINGVSTSLRSVLQPDNWWTWNGRRQPAICQTAKQIRAIGKQTTRKSW